MTTMRSRKLHRMWFSTDYSAEDPDYLGAISESFKVGDEQEIVDVDWSVPGEVQVTYLVPTDG